jgi:hypothetical protein
MAWHLSEIDACLTYAIEQQPVPDGRRAAQPPAAPETSQLAPGYRRIHEEALARWRPLTDEDLDREVTYLRRPAPERFGQVHLGPACWTT